MLTLLQIIQAAQAELGLPQSATVVGNKDATTVQMYNLANRVMDELRRMHHWTAQQFEFNLIVNPPLLTIGDLGQNSSIITNIPDTSQLQAAPYSWQVSANGLPTAARVVSVPNIHTVTMNMEVTGKSTTGATLTFAQDTYAMPSDFDMYTNRTMWDRTNRWELLGPDSPQLDQWHRSGIVVTGPRRHFRQLGPYGRQFRLWPAPIEITNPLQLVFEYTSLNAIVNMGQTAQPPPTVPGSSPPGPPPPAPGPPIQTNQIYKQYFNNDNDVPLLDDQAIILGLRWMFWEIKGFNYMALQTRWVDYVNRLIARDGAAPTLTLVKRVHPIFISPANVQDGFFPGPVGPNQA